MQWNWEETIVCISCRLIAKICAMRKQILCSAASSYRKPHDDTWRCHVASLVHGKNRVTWVDDAADLSCCLRGTDRFLDILDRMPCQVFSNLTQKDCLQFLMVMLSQLSKRFWCCNYDKTRDLSLKDLLIEYVCNSSGKIILVSLTLIRIC